MTIKCNRLRFFGLMLILFSSLSLSYAWLAQTKPEKLQFISWLLPIHAEIDSIYILGILIGLMGLLALLSPKKDY